MPIIHSCIYQWNLTKQSGLLGPDSPALCSRDLPAMRPSAGEFKEAASCPWLWVFCLFDVVNRLPVDCFPENYFPKNCSENWLLLVRLHWSVTRNIFSLSPYLHQSHLRTTMSMFELRRQCGSSCRDSHQTGQTGESWCGYRDNELTSSLVSFFTCLRLALRSMVTLCFPPSSACSMASADMRTFFRAGFFTPASSTTFSFRSSICHRPGTSSVSHHSSPVTITSFSVRTSMSAFWTLASMS